MDHQRKRKRSAYGSKDDSAPYSGRRHSPDSHNYHHKHSKRHRSCSRDGYDVEKNHYHREYTPKKDEHRRRHHKKYFEGSGSEESSSSSFVHSNRGAHRPQWREDTSKRKYHSKRPQSSRFHGSPSNFSREIHALSSPRLRCSYFSKHGTCNCDSCPKNSHFEATVGNVIVLRHLLIEDNVSAYIISRKSSKLDCSLLLDSNNPSEVANGMPVEGDVNVNLKQQLQDVNIVPIPDCPRTLNEDKVLAVETLKKQSLENISLSNEDVNNLDVNNAGPKTIEKTQFSFSGDQESVDDPVKRAAASNKNIWVSVSDFSEKTTSHESTSAAEKLNHTELHSRMITVGKMTPEISGVDLKTSQKEDSTDKQKASVTAAQRHFTDFIFKVYQDLSQYGPIIDMKPVSNGSYPHIRNTYVQYKNVDSAKRALNYDSLSICLNKVDIKMCEMVSLNDGVCPHQTCCLNINNCELIHYLSFSEELKKRILEYKKYKHPTRSEYRLIVENLSCRISWQDLKDCMRQAGEVVYADVYHQSNVGIVFFPSNADRKNAIKTLDGSKLDGRKIKFIEDKSKHQFNIPIYSDYSLFVENLSSRITWQKLKDHMKQVVNVTYVDVCKPRHKEGTVEFKNELGLQNAIKKFNGTNLKGCKLQLVKDKSRLKLQTKNLEKN